MPIFTKRIPMGAHANLQLGKLLGGSRLEMIGSGSMLMDFYPSLGPSPWKIRIRGVHLAWEPFRLPLPLDEHLNVDGFKVSNPDFDLPGCHGTYDPETGQVSIHLEILLRPNRIPALEMLGVKEALRVVVDEVGKMDFVAGRIIQTHAQEFRIPWNLPEGLMKVRAGQKTCESVGNLFVGVAGNVSMTELERYQPKTLYICPKTQLILAWDIEPVAKAKQAVITATNQSGNNLPPAIQVSLAKAMDSSKPISVTEDTTFTLKVADSSGCENEQSVDVHVVKPGTTLSMQASSRTGRSGV